MFLVCFLTLLGYTIYLILEFGEIHLVNFLFLSIPIMVLVFSIKLYRSIEWKEDFFYLILKVLYVRYGKMKKSWKKEINK